MTATQTLPIWVLLVFSILLIGIITLIYTRGNWRTTLLFVGLTLLVILGIAGIDAFNLYLKTHFVGQFDQLGIPFREAGPGWSILPAAWPLWLVPTLFVSLLAVAADFLIYNYLPKEPLIAVEKKPPAALPTREPIPIPTPTMETMQAVVARKLELESLKHELAATKEKLESAITIAEETLDKNQDLEIEIDQLKEEQQENTLDQEDRITALDLEVAAKEAENEELTTLALQQAEEIAKLKDQLETLTPSA